jgi:hypothetical protein
MTGFVAGSTYTREQVAEIIGLPEDHRRGGPWATGYARWKSQIFIFCNVGVPGRTGHDYPNRWEDKSLVWYGKTQSKLGQPLIDTMVSGSEPVHIFWRAQDRAPFTYAGLAAALDVKATVPVEVTWTFESPFDDHLDGDDVKTSRLRWRRGPPPTPGEKVSVFADAPTSIYVFRLSGPVSAILPKLEDDRFAIKVGMSQDPRRRLVELNSGFFPGSLMKWELIYCREYPDGKSAFAAENKWLEHLRLNYLWVGGEFAILSATQYDVLLGV